ncbi:MAG: hypothetical protein HC853_01985 [Anaerolineae bacterium]|nr:hypothetical protein [Anaerolineae bacterium]
MQFDGPVRTVKGDRKDIAAFGAMVGCKWASRRQRPRSLRGQPAGGLGQSASGDGEKLGDHDETSEGEG